MTGIEVYLNFANGTCEDALNFYAGCFGGQITSLRRFSDIPGQEMPAETKNLVLHATFQCPAFSLMASDCPPHIPLVAGNNTHLNLDFEDAAEQAAVFNTLCQGGTVVMPLENTFWGACFGMVTDRYGISWMVNRQLAQ